MITAECHSWLLRNCLILKGYFLPFLQDGSHFPMNSSYMRNSAHFYRRKRKKTKQKIAWIIIYFKVPIKDLLSLIGFLSVLAVFIIKFMVFEFFIGDETNKVFLLNADDVLLNSILEFIDLLQYRHVVYVWR